MEFQTPKETLLRGIQVVQNIAGTKTTLPILNNILIKTKKDRLLLATTDLEMAMICEVPGQIVKEGSITIPAKRFGDIVRELPDMEIKIEVKKNHVVIKNKSCQFKILGLPEEEFPKLPEFGEDENVDLEQKILKQTLFMTAFAVSFDQTRHILNGALFHLQPNLFRVVTTDGRRLALCNVRPGKEEEWIKKQVIVPARAVLELTKNLRDAGRVRVCFRKNQIAFRFDEITMISRLIEGEYPDYARVIPGESRQKLRADRGALQMALRRASLLTSAESPAVVLELGKNRLVISKNNPEIGEAHEELTVQYEGPELKIGFNPAYLLDAIKAIEAETIELELPAADKPGVIRLDQDYLYLVLPMELG